MREVPGQRDVGEGVQLQSDTQEQEARQHRGDPGMSAALRAHRQATVSHVSTRSFRGQGRGRRLGWDRAGGYHARFTQRDQSGDQLHVATRILPPHTHPLAHTTPSPALPLHAVCKVQLKASPGAIERGVLPR